MAVNDWLIAQKKQPYHLDAYAEYTADKAKRVVKFLQEKFEMKVTDAKNFLQSDPAKIEVAIEVHGSIFHGCPCQNRNALHPFTKKPMHQALAETQQRTNFISRQGLVVLEIFECQLKKVLREKKCLATAFSAIVRKEPFLYRNGFFGGRTEAIVRYYEACECDVRPTDETCKTCNKARHRLLYLDVTSLYPYTNATKSYPIGHPVKHLNIPVGELFEYFGMAQVEILPPRNLLLPVLLVKNSNGRLVFSLCRTCSDTHNMQQCTHENESERSFVCTFPIPELKKAVDHRYVIKKFHQVQEWKESPDTLFRSYMKQYFEMKMAYSGIDDEMQARFGTDQAAIKQYLRDNSEQYCGFKIELENDIVKKPALKFVSKLQLNSLWGRTGMRQGGKKGAWFSSNQADKMFALYCDPTIKVVQMNVVESYDNNTMIHVEHQPLNKICTEICTVNVLVAAFTTSYARMLLYDICMAAGAENVLYMDIDNVIIKEDALPRLQKFTKDSFMLGQLKQELRPNEYNVEWGTLGPKSYGYRTSMGKVEKRVKGFRLDKVADSVVTLGRIAEVVRDHECGLDKENNQKISVRKHVITKGGDLPGRIISRYLTESFQSTTDSKRYWTGKDAQTYPFGYKEIAF